MSTAAKYLDISVLPPASRRVIRDYYEFLLSRQTPKTDTENTHNQWATRQIEAAVKIADDPATEFVSHETVKSRWADKKRELLARLPEEQKA